MREDVSLNYRRWLSADRPVGVPDDSDSPTATPEPADDGDPESEADGGSPVEDEADEAFAALYETCVSLPLPSAQFTSQTMAAIAAAAAADARRAKVVRRALVWSGIPAGIALAYFGAGPLFSALSNALVAGLNLLVAVVVWFANGADVRSGIWSAMTGIGRAAAAFVADPRVTIAIVVFQVVAVAALAALHRLLGPEREWLK
jgi:hypothetical protein